MITQSESITLIQSVIEQTKGNSDRFAETLRENHIPHLSFSQISIAEFCEYRYFLQYEAAITPAPIPDYFTKGKLLHQMIAASYSNLATHGIINKDHYYKLINQHYQGDHEIHLRNAITLHLENLWQNCEVVAVEEPFVMQIDDQLPPCVGVIDLILKQDGKYILIDHKTGRDFYPQDELQMAIYVEYIKRRYGGSDSRFYYEQYRWVNNLNRIRKPAFQRTEVVLPGHSWQQSLQRIQSSFQSIREIKAKGVAAKDGECFRCPYRNICWKA